MTIEINTMDPGHDGEVSCVIKVTIGDGSIGKAEASALRNAVERVIKAFESK